MYTMRVQCSTAKCMGKLAKILALNGVSFVCNTNIKVIELETPAVDGVFTLLEENNLTKIDHVQLNGNHYDYRGVNLGY